MTHLRNSRAWARGKINRGSSAIALAKADGNASAGSAQPKQNLSNLQKETLSLRNPKKAKLLQRFFKTGKGQYGEGDIFLGIMVPQSRKLAFKYRHLDLADVAVLLKSKFHEQRLIALLILVQNFQAGDEKTKRGIYKFYLKSARFINNWDLVDLSAPKIVGPYLWNKDRKILHEMVKSENLWKRRIAVLATFDFIRQGDFKDALLLTTKLLGDKNDLIHKATGWMLREIGKKSLNAELSFLEKYYKIMPRTMLRYSIERFDEKLRLRFLNS